MARIRAIKPEFWSSPNLPEDPWTRLLYIAMWNWADDMGVGTANPREVGAFAFPNDDEITPGGVRRMFGEVHRVFGVKFYEVAGRPYFAIPNWQKHQKFDNRSKGKYPGPDEAETWLYQEFSQEPAESAGVTSSTRRDAVAGTGEQWNRGTGEQRNRGTETPAISSRDLETLFESAYSRWPKKVERKKSLDKFVQACKSRDIGELVADIQRFGDAYAATTDKQFVPALNVWINGERWSDELPQKRQANSAPSKAEQAWDFVNGGDYGVSGSEAGVRGYLEQ